MSSKKLCLAVSTHIQQKTLFPRRILAYSDFLGQTSVPSQAITTFREYRLWRSGLCARHGIELCARHGIEFGGESPL